MKGRLKLTLLQTPSSSQQQSQFLVALSFSTFTAVIFSLLPKRTPSRTSQTII